MDEHNRPTRDPWLAVNLSLVLPGLGQLYAGARKRGALLVLASVAAYAGLHWTIFSPGGDLTDIAVVLGATAALVVASLFDAHRCARKANSPAAEQARKQGKDPYLAVFLTRLLPGLGHLYAGRPAAGIVLLLILAALCVLPVPKRGEIAMLLLWPVYVAAACLWAFAAGLRGRQRGTAGIWLLSGLIAGGGLGVIGGALLARRYVVEAFHVPTGGMAPTLRGLHVERSCPACGFRCAVGARPSPGGGHAGPVSAVCPNCGREHATPRQTQVREGDRVFVWKCFRPFQALRGWDVVVFRYPQDRRAKHVKRLAGLPGQMLEIVHGDVYVRQGADLNGDGTIDEADFRQADAEGRWPWRILRKPPKTQQALWRPVFDSDLRPDASVGGPPASVVWQPADKEAWDLTGEGGRTFRFLGSKAAAELRLSAPRERFAPGLAYSPPPAGAPDLKSVVYDLRLSLTATTRDPGAQLGMHLNCFEHHFRAWVADGWAALEHGQAGPDGRIPWKRLHAAKAVLTADHAHRLAFTHRDGRAALEVDGREVLATTDETYPLGRGQVVQTVQRLLESGQDLPAPSVAILARGGRSELRHVRLERDVYYTFANVWEGERRTRRPGYGTMGNPIVLRRYAADPARDELFVLGDNSTASLDSRFYGPVPAGDVIGLAYKRYWPLERFGPVP